MSEFIFGEEVLSVLTSPTRVQNLLKGITQPTLLQPQQELEAMSYLSQAIQELLKTALLVARTLSFTLRLWQFQKERTKNFRSFEMISDLEAEIKLKIQRQFFNPIETAAKIFVTKSSALKAKIEAAKPPHDYLKGHSKCERRRKC